MIKRLLLIIPLIALPLLASCAPCRSLETAQKAPALQPLSKDVSIRMQESTMRGSTIPIVESGTHLARDHY
ncbi:MAG: hypothetical protein VX527_00895 [Planctomycetota bacterium]|nr:hypothetical protein [Planctomycetota bacterium]